MKLSEFYTSISSGRTDEEYFFSKNNFSVVSSLFLQFGKNQSSSDYFHVESYEYGYEENASCLHLYEGDVQLSGNTKINIDTSTLNLNTSYLKLNNHSLNTANGLVKLDKNGKIPSSLIINYQISNTFMLSGSVYYNCTETPLSNITFTFDKSMNNSMCLFKTDSTITFNFSYPETGVYLNEPINLDPDSIYLISMENNVIMWSELVEAINLSN